MSTYHATHVGALQPRDPFAGITLPLFLAGPQRALCADHDPEVWFSTAEAREYEAVRICMRCPLIKGCQLWAIEHAEAGIWGGLTEHKRTKIRHRREAVA